MITKKPNYSAEDVHYAQSSNLSSPRQVPEIVVNSPTSSFANNFPQPQPSRQPSLPPPPPYTPELTQILEDLNAQIATLERSRAQTPPNKQQISTQATQVYTTMLRISEIHPDPNVRHEYKAKAEEFRKGDDKKRNTILRDLALIVVAPIVITGSALVLAGGIITGTGKLVTEIGHCMTGSKLRGFKFRHKSASTSHLPNNSSTRQ